MNRVLILGGFGLPALGARGAGISTSVTFTVEAALAAGVLLRGGRPAALRGAPRASREEYVEEARAVGRIAFPALLERALYHAGYLGFVAILALLGDAPMAANQALLSVESICYLSADGFGVAAAALVAQKLGAARPEEAVRAARLSAGPSASAPSRCSSSHSRSWRRGRSSPRPCGAPGGHARCSR
jgi:multidrug resistance protein, MATE family